MRKTLEEMSTYIKYISQSSKRMQTLVKGIMEYSRIGTEEESVIVDCNEIVNEVLTDLSHTLKQLNAKVTVDHLPKVPTRIKAIVSKPH
jgi:light-regulated signal transduction histidine kinase (bacteriophytochrome)